MQEATCDIQESEVLAQMPRNQEQEGLSDAQHPGVRVGDFVTQTDTHLSHATSYSLKTRQRVRDTTKDCTTAGGFSPLYAQRMHFSETAYQQGPTHARDTAAGGSAVGHVSITDRQVLQIFAVC